MLDPNSPALVLAPMDGITDAPMRALQGEFGGFTYAVSEFCRVSIEALPAKVFRRDIPELETGSRTISGLPVQVQILGGDPDRMATSAVRAVKAGAIGIDINFGCPAPIVNRHDGGASLLRCPSRIYEVVRAIRDAVPPSIPVSAKLRLGWDSIEPIHENAEMVAKAGASWLTIHARTKSQGYLPPVYWNPIYEVRRNVGIPVVANGDIWNFEDFLRCREATGCSHFMVGRGSLANPLLSNQIASELGLPVGRDSSEWLVLFRSLASYSALFRDRIADRTILRLKQWMKFAHTFGEFPFFHELKLCVTTEELLSKLEFLEDRRVIESRIQYASTAERNHPEPSRPHPVHCA